MHRKKLKIAKLKPTGKIGRISRNDVDLEPNEEETIKLLAELGFGIDCLKKNHIPKSHSADIVMLGTIWEMKSPESINRKTLKKRIHKASLQSTHIIFDLRRLPSDTDSIEEIIIEKFKEKSTLRRLVIIRPTGEALDFQK